VNNYKNNIRSAANSFAMLHIAPKGAKQQEIRKGTKDG
jgi:hypothetical protein